MALRCIVLILRHSGKNIMLTSEKKKREREREKKDLSSPSRTVDVALRLIYQLNNLLGGSLAMDMCDVRTVKPHLLMFNFLWVYKKV